MSKPESLLVVGFTDSARNVIDELRKLADPEIIWIGEGENPDSDDDVEVVNIENPTLPSNVEDFSDKYNPKMIFLCPGAERDLVNLIEGDNLERLLYKEDIRLDNVPTIVISDEHHS